MKEQLTENQDPVNVAAKKALKEAGVEPWPDCLYALQLAHWALTSGKVSARDYMLENFVEALLYRGTPEWGLRMILVQVDEEQEDWEEIIVPVYMSPDMNPAELAASILENISMSLTALDSNYMDADRLSTLG